MVPANPLPLLNTFPLRPTSVLFPPTPCPWCHFPFLAHNALGGIADGELVDFCDQVSTNYIMDCNIPEMSCGIGGHPADTVALARLRVCPTSTIFLPLIWSSGADCWNGWSTLVSLACLTSNFSGTTNSSLNTNSTHPFCPCNFFLTRWQGRMGE